MKWVCGWGVSGPPRQNAVRLRAPAPHRVARVDVGNVAERQSSSPMSQASQALENPTEPL